ncbi:hypothetical protein Hamer_G003411 [Homarus americanus]|uniref:Uncharacterized protein n=1 Tax=Homarus americanus TaxID=6706 RepID=A0A8J5THG4_HOMAM|nr:hypothetical protein Hamer_G003411 [Homarus americanus]
MIRVGLDTGLLKCLRLDDSAVGLDTFLQVGLGTGLLEAVRLGRSHGHDDSRDQLGILDHLKNRRPSVRQGDNSSDGISWGDDSSGSNTWGNNSSGSQQSHGEDNSHMARTTVTWRGQHSHPTTLA